MKKSYCKKQLTYLILFFSMSVFSLNAQIRNCNYVLPQQADNWIFGRKANINFNQDPPFVVPTQADFDIAYGVSSISDQNGNLLLFTNGMQVWNQAYFTMENGSGLNGSAGSSQSSIIIPHPGNGNQYFIFTIDMYIPPPINYGDGVNYSVVDFSQNGYGSVTSKNNLLFTENSNKVCAIKHENGTDYWVVFHGFGPNKGQSFYSYLVDTSGVVMTPVISNVGSTHTGDYNTNNQRGYMKASSNGEKIGLVLPDDGIIELLDFDKSTGQITNPVSSAEGAFYYPFGLEFSPNNNQLYITTSPKESETSYLYQFDLNNSSPFDNSTIINSFYFSTISSSPADSLMQALQLGGDGKIYVGKTTRGNLVGKPTLGVIYNPDRPGLACNYNEIDQTPNNGMSLNGGFGLSGLPNFITDYLNIPHFYYLNQCLNDTTDFIIRNTANLLPTWNFTDINGISIMTDPMRPKHIFSESGTFGVQLTETYAGEDYVFTEDIVINPLPSISIGSGSNIIYILQGSSIRLDAGEGMDIYSWTPGGSSSRYIDVTEPGIYSAQITDFNCCTNSDTVEIRFASLSFPNAFKPASAIAENQTFSVVGNISAIAKYQFQIFNRWGQLIFEADDPTEGWDGNQDGSAAPMGTYIYSAVFTSYESGIQASIDIKNTGTVTVIR